MRILCSRALALRDVARVVGARGSAAAVDASGGDREPDFMLDEMATTTVMGKENPERRAAARPPIQEY